MRTRTFWRLTQRVLHDGMGTLIAVALSLLLAAPIIADESAPTHSERLFEATFESRKTYVDPFNDVNVDVIFLKDGQSWRVPTFWRGDHRWTVRFAPLSPGEYTYRLESTDRTNVDLNGREGHVLISSYTGPSSVLRHGMLRVSANGRHFEHADGTPFFWLGPVDASLSEGLPWDAFEQLVAKGTQEGYTVGSALTGLDPEGGLEPAPRGEPGCRIDPGTAWDSSYKHINPQYFDCLDRRIQYLLNHDLVPSIIGAWNGYLKAMGVQKMEQHWRYLIARYGAYPAFWWLGGEVFDPPQEILQRAAAHHMTEFVQKYYVEQGWTEVAKYIRATDPYHHPLTAHELPPPFDVPLQDENAEDFDTFQSGHYGWASIAAEVAQMNMHYSRTSVTKPLVQGEICGWGMLEDYERVAFWLSMLNGAAGHECGLGGGVYRPAEAPVSPYFVPSLTWEEGLNRLGPYQIGIGAKLLRQYRWWQFEPHPEWVTPRGTTLLEPHKELKGFDLGPWEIWTLSPDEQNDSLQASYPGGEWAAHHGNFYHPYAAGIPGETRFIYMPYVNSILPRAVPTVLRLELGVRYHAYFWMPSTGVKFDLGSIERPAQGQTIFQDEFDHRNDSAWSNEGRTSGTAGSGALSPSGQMIMVLKNVHETNAVASVGMKGRATGGLLLRYRDNDNYVAAIYSAADRSLYIIDRENGSDGKALGQTSIPELSTRVVLSAEVREDKAIAEISDGNSVLSTPIVDVTRPQSGSVGMLHEDSGLTEAFTHFELRRSPALVRDQTVQRELFDARGRPWGKLVDSASDTDNPYHQSDFDWEQSANWTDFSRKKNILLDAWQPERLPSVYGADWLLVLERQDTRMESPSPVLTLHDRRRRLD